MTPFSTKLCKPTRVSGSENKTQTQQTSVIIFAEMVCPTGMSTVRPRCCRRRASVSSSSSASTSQTRPRRTLVHPPTVPPSAWRQEPHDQDGMGMRSWGTAITCSTEDGIDPEHRYQLVHHLRHKYILNLYHGSDIGKLLHGVSLYQLSESLGPPPTGLFFEQPEELLLVRGLGGSPGTRPC